MFPRHKLVAKLIQRSIAAGEFPPGVALPAGAELAERFAASPDEIQRAMAILAADGLIVYRDDSRAVVRQPPVQTHNMSVSARIDKPLPSRDDMFRAEANEVGLTPSHQTEVSTGPSSPEVAARLEIDGAQEVVHRRTLRFTNEEPTALEDAYYPAILGAAAGPANVDDIDRRLDALGYLRAGWLDAITARPATPNEAAVLRLEAGQPVVEHSRVEYSMRIGGEVRPVSYIRTYIRTVFAGDRNRLVYQYKQPDVPVIDERITSAGTT